MSRTWSSIAERAKSFASTHRLAAGGVLLVAAAVLYWGWQLHWFLTDDAFIAFRFIDNRQRGFGYTWNAPPFLPVEGYTSFGWVLLLDLIWSVFGIEPPEIANSVSLMFALGTLALTSWASHRICVMQRVSAAGSIAITAAVLAALVVNRTFLVWASGGLETAFYNFLLQSWLLAAFLGLSRSNDPRGLAVVCGLASVVEIARPDGLLPVACSVAIVIVYGVLRVMPIRTALACASPLLLTAAHLLWRRSFYGEWLPNTYYAKVVAPWPAAGLRYLAAFGVEYAYYLALPLWALAAWLWGRDSVRGIAAASGGSRRAAIARLLVQAGLLATVLAMLGFNVLIAGGDHFEYRVLSFLCPLLALAVAYSCLVLRMRAVASALVIAGFGAISAVLPWLVFANTNHRSIWPAQPVVVPIAASAPLVLRPAAQVLDGLELWLIPHGVGIRHYEHRAFYWHLAQGAPMRDSGEAACSAADHPIAATGNIGVVSWVLPTCAILDTRGLCDYVIARMPAKLGYLGHDHVAPREYFQSFQPNVMIERGQVRISRRPRPLSDAGIEETEQRYRSLVRERN